MPQVYGLNSGINYLLNTSTVEHCYMTGQIRLWLFGSRLECDQGVGGSSSMRKPWIQLNELIAQNEWYSTTGRKSIFSRTSTKGAAPSIHQDNTVLLFSSFVSRSKRQASSDERCRVQTTLIYPQASEHFTILTKRSALTKDHGGMPSKASNLVQ